MLHVKCCIEANMCPDYRGPLFKFVQIFVEKEILSGVPYMSNLCWAFDKFDYCWMMRTWSLDNLDKKIPNKR